MKSSASLSLLALAAAPISAWPWGQRDYLPDPIGPYPYHHPKHPNPTAGSTGSVPPFPYSGASGGYFPTGTRYHTGTGYPTGTVGTVGTGIPSGYLPIPSCAGPICPLGLGPEIPPKMKKRAYTHRGPYGGPHTAPYYPTTIHGGPTGGPTGGSGTGFHPHPTGTGSPSHSLIIDSSQIESATGGNPTGTGTASASISTKSAVVPGSCLKKNGIAIGWLPEAATDFQTITSNLGSPGCYFGQYSQITSSTYDDSQLTQVTTSDLQGAILIASVQPWIPFTEVDSNVASQVAASMKKFTDQGVEVYLRFGHEMNWYATPQGKDYHGTAPEFITAWKNIAAAVADNSKVSMFWSPNNVGGDSASLNAWWPGPETVDIVGIDIYPTSRVSFADAYKGFHDTFAKAYDKPFVIGETAYSSSSDEDKTYWLQQLSSPEAKSSCPNYAGFSWFEYNKEQDFYVASHGEGIAKSVLG
ncbi:MAG: hypothetical protein HETSPECPRED_008335 [Heterodermia speciosa]|uniref:GH26 domain-containing protein n=1 Tax=Heterodermia speciosa TaxID=116794 RepID=A0A8H3ILE6_9LECA|nr:MAG: hypothetical protein HETSPECPRED_008335 [Heterodermia speciosa]